MKNTIEEARKLIGSSKTSAAIDLLSKAVDSRSESYAAVMIQSAKLKDIAKKEMLGIISFDDAMMARNQINYALLEIINELEPALTKSEQPKVFISYNHTDAVVANKIKERLKSEGIAVTIDSEAMGAGENIETFIEKCVRENDTTLSVVSKKSLLSAWVAMESVNTFYQEKAEKTKKFIPCYIETDFFDQKFTDDAVKELDKKIDALSSVMATRITEKRGIDDIDDERGRLLDLKHYIDKIVGRLRSSLCIDIREENFENGIKKVIERIKE